MPFALILDFGAISKSGKILDHPCIFTKYRKLLSAIGSALVRKAQKEEFSLPLNYKLKLLLLFAAFAFGEGEQDSQYKK